MIAKPPHNRKLGVTGVSLTLAPVSDQMRIALGLARDELERLLIDTDYLGNAPFFWVTVQVNFGLKYSERPIIGRISKKYGDLPLTVEVDTNDLVDGDIELIQGIFTKAISQALLYAGSKYDRPTGALAAKLIASQLRTGPVL